MRRHTALRGLSSDHHLVLVIARRARKAARKESCAQGVAWEEVKKRFFGELEGHFRREEVGLLPMLCTAGEAPLVQRTLSEHRTLRTLVAEDRPDNLSVFAEMLAAHIRFEETELFEAAQRLLNPDVLAHLEQVPTDERQTVQVLRSPVAQYPPEAAVATCAPFSRRNGLDTVRNDRIISLPQGNRFSLVYRHE
jgi:hypothetical protein